MAGKTIKATSLPLAVANGAKITEHVWSKGVHYVNIVKDGKAYTRRVV